MATENPASTTFRPIAFFIPGLNGGGAQRVFVTLVNTLVTMTQHPIHLVTSRGGGAFESHVDERVVRIVLGREHVSQSVLRLVRYIRTERPVAIISTLNYCNVIFLVATLFTRIRLRKVIREANVLHDDFPSVIARGRATVVRLLMRLVYRRADDVIIIAADVERSLIQHRIASANKMRRIPNPVFVENEPIRFSPSAAIASEPFVLAIGRLSHQKGFDILIRAFAQLAQTEIKLVILGEGPLEFQLKKLAAELGVQERVAFPGFVQNPATYLRSACLFVLSSRWEGFSNVLVEALAVGLPIVATDCPGSAREVLLDGRLGRLVRVDAPEELASAIAAELKSPTGVDSARRTRADEYHPIKIAQQYLDVLRPKSDA